LPTNADHDPLLLDTSAALALVDASHPGFTAVETASAGRRLGLAGHAVWETLSVLTRLPPPHRLSGQDALRLIEVNFPESRQLAPQVVPALMREFAAKGILGGAVWDGLVGAAARSHGLTLISTDRRAQPVYELLKVNYQLY
jgi:predicted nucleic acid-binding protein